MPHRHPTRRLLSIFTTVALTVLAALVLSGITARHRAMAAYHTASTVTATGPGHHRHPHPAPVVPGNHPPHAARPNIVFVLADDLSMDLLRYMPQVQALAHHGMTFRNYFVSDSLCCPSRTSIFTGEFPHDSGVFTNSGADGGMTAFYDHGDEQRSFNIALQQAGYRTAMMGKYINGYLDGPNRSPVPDTYVPPGWNEWDVAGWGYPEYDYTLNENGTLHHFGHAPDDYLTSVMTRRAVSFIDRRSRASAPFFLELASFTPHTPYVPAWRDRHLFRGLKAPHPPNFGAMPVNAPSWLAGHAPLGPRKLRRINWVFRRRAQDVQSIDRMIARVEQALAKRGMLKNTLIVFSSDNGLHTGEYRLMPGKLTAFDTDVHVPLVVAGPGVPAGSSTDAMSENVDLAETFAQLGGTSLYGDGHSLAGLLHGVQPSDWRSAVLVEHHGPPYDPAVDPDAQTGTSGNPTSYEAMRTPGFLYVEYTDGEREYYNLRTDPFELDNLAPDLTSANLDLLHAELTSLETCHGATTCWAAGHIQSPVGPLLRRH